MPNFVISLLKLAGGNDPREKIRETTQSLTDVIGHEVGGETLGAVAERRVVVRVAAEDEQGAAEQDG